MQRGQALRRAVVLVGLLLVGAATRAQIYGGSDSAGTLVLSNFATEGVAAVVVAADPALPTDAPAAAPTRDPLRVPASYRDAIHETARKHALSAQLLAAVIAVESNFNARAVSHKGAKGLMQLMPDTARRFGVRDAFAADQNLEGGAAYLRELLVLFGGDLRLALAAYNAGEGAVMRAGRRVPAYPETQQYVAKVLAYAGLIPTGRVAAP